MGSRPSSGLPEKGPGAARAASGLAAAVVAAAAATLYLPSRSYGRVWEDTFLLSGEESPGRALLACFTHPFLWFYRPIVPASFCIERMLWGSNAFLSHQTNILVHVVTALALMGLLRTAFQSRRIAFLGGLLFAVQPVQVSAVAWMGGRPDSLCALWVALYAWAMVCAARESGQRRTVLLALATLAFALAVLTKEIALPALFLAPLAFRCWSDERGKALDRAMVRATLPLLLVAVMAVLLSAEYVTYRGRPEDEGLACTMAAILRTTCSYALLLFAPTVRLNHTFGLGPFVAAGGWALAFGAALLIGAVLLFRYWLRTAPAAAWFLALIVSMLTLVSNAIAIGWPISPYRAAPAGIGACALAAWGLDRLMRAGANPKSRLGRPLPALACVGVFAWWALVTVRDIPNWRDQLQADRAIVQCDPDSVWARVDLCHDLADRGRVRETRALLEAGLTRIYASEAWRDPDSAARALHDAPSLLRRLRDCDGHIPGRQVLGGLYAALSWAHATEGDASAAEAVARTGLAVCPDNAELRADLQTSFSPNRPQKEDR